MYVDKATADDHCFFALRIVIWAKANVNNRRFQLKRREGLSVTAMETERAANRVSLCEDFRLVSALGPLKFRRENQ